MSINGPLTPVNVFVDADNSPIALSGKNDKNVIRLGGAPAVFEPPTPNYTGIMIARAAAIANGGGVVQLKPIDYDIGDNTIPLARMVVFRGAGVGYGYSGVRGVFGGTRVIGGTTKNVFEHNAVDAGAQVGSQALMYAGSIFGAGVQNMTIVGGLNGIRIGGLYSSGAFHCKFSDLHIQNPVRWCGFFENVSLSSFKGITTSCINSGDGHLWFGASHGAIYNHGNSHIEDLFCEGGRPLTRNIVFMARGGGSSLNDMTVLNIQCNAQGQTLNEAATMANGSADITVASAAQYPLDMPVTVQANANGFSAGQSYFVVYSQGTTIRLSDHQGGAVRNASGAAAVTLVRHGFPCVEIVGHGSANENSIQPSTFIGVDAEGVATTCVLAQNSAIFLGFNFAFGAGASVGSTLAARNAFGSYQSPVGLSTDLDGGSAVNFLAMGANIRTNNSVNNAAQGYIRDVTNNVSGLMMGSSGDGARLSLQGINTSGRSFLYPHHSIGQRVWVNAAANVNLYGIHHGCGAYVGNTNAVWNLPAITGAAGGAANSYPGSTWEIANCTTTGGVTLTINTQAGQPINRQAGKTQIVLQPGQSITLRAQTNGGADFFWQVAGNNGVVI